MYKKLKCLFFGLCVTAFGEAIAQLSPEMYQNPELYYDTMPIPKQFDHLLFYVQRTKDKNTAVYLLNYDKNGNIVNDDPIKARWVNYETDTSKTDLSYFQRKLTYGVTSESIIGGHKLTFAAFKERKASLRKDDETGRYFVYTTLNDKLAILHKIYVEVKGGSFLFPKIGMVHFYGSCARTGEPIHEKYDY